jgi:hypothetical protein
MYAEGRLRLASLLRTGTRNLASVGVGSETARERALRTLALRGNLHQFALTTHTHSLYATPQVSLRWGPLVAHRAFEGGQDDGLRRCVCVQDWMKQTKTGGVKRLMKLFVTTPGLERTYLSFFSYGSRGPHVTGVRSNRYLHSINPPADAGQPPCASAPNQGASIAHPVLRRPFLGLPIPTIPLSFSPRARKYEPRTAFSLAENTL